jgi:hypothetical protein
VPDGAWEPRVGQIVAPAVEKRLTGYLGRLIDSTRSRVDTHAARRLAWSAQLSVDRPLGFHPESRTALISPGFDAVVARYTTWLLSRDSAVLTGVIPARPRLSMAIFAGLDEVHLHIVGNTLVIHIELYLNQQAWGKVWRLPPDKAPYRVMPVPVHNVSLAAALERGDLSGTYGELLAHTLPLRGCYGASMISPMLVILAGNSDRFIGDERASKDIDDEIEAGCLEKFLGVDLEMVPYCSITQSTVDKKLAAHLKAQGQEPKVRRIANKKAGFAALLSPSVWVNSQCMLGLNLTRLDVKLDAVVAMCAMAVALNSIEAKAGRPTAWGVYMSQGDAHRAYRNLLSCPTEVWKSGLYDVRLDEHNAAYLTRYVDTALDFGGEANPTLFCLFSYCMVLSWAVLVRALAHMLASELVIPAMLRSRATGFTREHRLRHYELRSHNDMPEQEGAVVTTAVTPVDPPALDVIESEFHKLAFERCKIPRALTHPDDCQTSRDMFRASSYSDDFDMVQVDTPDNKRVAGARAALQQVGAETKIPFGAKKWDEGAPLSKTWCASALGSTSLTLRGLWYMYPTTVSKRWSS